MNSIKATQEREDKEKEKDYTVRICQERLALIINMLEQIKGGLVVSYQMLPDESLHLPFIVGKTALAVKQGGAAGIRAQSREDIIEIKKVVDLPVIGIMERSYPDSDICITATKKELDELFETRCKMIAMDATLRDRPNRGKLEDLVSYVYEHGVLTMADYSTYEECVNVENIGFSCISTTLCGYTPYSKSVDGPDLELFKKLAETVKALILAEGKIDTPEDLAVIYEAGAYGTVVGNIIARPKQIIERFVRALKK